MKKYILFLLISILNSFFIALFPDYFFAYLWILILGVCLFAAIICADLLGKTHFWVESFYVLSLGILSLLLGMKFMGGFLN